MKDKKFYLWFVPLTVCFLYVLIVNSLLLRLQYLGAPLVLLHPFLVGVNTASKVEIIPQIIILIYICISYFVILLLSFKKSRQ